MCLSWGIDRRKREKTVLESGHPHHSPTEHSAGGKHCFCDTTFLLFLGQGWRLQDLYTHRLFPLPHRNWSGQLMLCAKARDCLINKTIATKKKEGTPLFNKTIYFSEAFPFPRMNNEYILWNKFNYKASIPTHPEKTPIPLANAKQSPKMWRKLKNVEGLSVCLH